MKKIIVTGITGSIGQYIVEPLKELGFEVYGIGRRDLSTNEFHYIKSDINNSIDMLNIFNQIKPEYLVHLAWDLGVDHYVSNSNFELLASSLNILKYFKENGGKKAIFIGTCLEYKFKNTPLKENDELNPTTIYSKCKNYLRELSELYCANNNIDFVWCRIFNTYGKDDQMDRLFPFIINSLKNNKKTLIKHSQLKKDYIYTGDVAKIISLIANSDINGIINICSGIAISLKEFATIIASKMDKEHLLELMELDTDSPSIIVGDNSRILYELKFNTFTNLKDIVGDYTL